MRFLFSIFFSFIFSFSFAQNSLQQHIKYHVDQPNNVGLISINDRSSAIGQDTWLYVKKALDYYKEKPPIFIILELNTPGGEVFSAQSISDALKEMDVQYDVPVVAYINNWAISAGAMIAYSTRFIAVAPDASMGAAEPVIQDSSGKLEQASEKVNSAMRSDMANRAKFFGRNPEIAEAMVDKDLILVERSGKIIKLNSESEILTTDRLISAKGKLLTLDTEQLLQYRVADFLVPTVKREQLTEKELADGVFSAKKLALFHTSFFEDIPNAFIDQYKPDWKTRFFMFLSNPMVASFLFMAMLLGFYMEFNMPSATWPLLIGASALSLIILSSFSQEIGSYLELILLGIGALLLMVELFVFPTFGLLGVIGGFLFLGGLFGLMLPGLR
ncbi:MAG TPA: serine protease, partial [Parachlamydiaceae bacterium]|nr:serine protease [Parachlamydiaceae bacterium]